MKFVIFLLFFVTFISLSCGISIPYVYLKYFKQRAIDIIDKAGPKDDCSRHLKAWVGDLFNVKKLWSLQMLDASAKLQTGFMAGNIGHWGNYDQCLQISEDKGNDGLITGQYCTVAILPVKNATSDTAHFLDFTRSLPELMGVEEGKELKHILKIFRVLFGVCLPKSCSAEKIQKLWDYIEYTFRLPVHASWTADLCSYKGKVPQVFHFDKYVIWTFVLIFFVMCLATVYDLTVCQKLGEFTLPEKLLTSFSVSKNLKSIFHYPPANPDNNLSCINGLKVISMLWVIFSHRHLIDYVSGTTNMLDYFEWRRGLVGLIVLLAPFAVDTFLTISGLLLTYKYMEIRDALPPNKSMPYLMFYFLRFLRLWPALIATILFYTSVIKYLNNGPLWTMLMYKMSFTCANTGWLSAIFMTNMVDFKYQCLEPSWYLAVDTQLYCIAPILLYFLHRYPKRATFTFLLLSCISAWYAYMVTVDTKVKWALSEADERYYMLLYQSPFVRMPSWILGILTGALLYNFPHIRIPKELNVFIWIIVMFIWLGIAKVTNIMISTPYNEYSAGIYNALTRPAWSLAICLVIFLCATSHGGVINKMLSLRIYHVIVKLSYSIYLIHMAVTVIVSGNKRASAFHNFFTTFHGFLGDLPFIFAASLIWCLAFESPFLNIAKILIQSNKNAADAQVANDRKRLSKTAWGKKAIVPYNPGNNQFKIRKNK